MLDKKKAMLSFIVSFLLGFMLLIFGPAEIFFANVSEFEFLYGEFAGYMALIFLGILIVFTIVLTLLPEKIHRIMLSVLFAISVAGYLQVMVLNKNSVDTFDRHAGGSACLPSGYGAWGSL